MKKLILVLLVIFVITAAGIGIFIASFDINRFKPMVEEKVEEALGNPARIGSLFLGWDGGLAVGLRDLQVFEAGSSPQEAALSVRLARAVLELGPLMKKEIKFASIVIKAPSLHAVKAQDGSFKVRGIDFNKKEDKKTGTGTAGASEGAAAFFIGEVRIQDGVVRVTDGSFSPPVDILLRDIDFSLKNVSLDRPMTLALQIAAFDEEQNTRVRGKVALPKDESPGLLTDFFLDLDLARLDSAQLRQQIPQLKDLKFKEDPSGKLHVSVPRMDLGGNGAPDIQAQIGLSEGRIFFQDSPGAFDAIELEATAQGERFVLNKLQSEFAGGRLQAQGQSEYKKPNAPMSFAFSASDLKVQQLVPQKGPGKPSVKGRLWLEFQGRGLGSDRAAVSQTLQGQGKITLREGILVNVNVLRDVLKKMSAIPGLSEGLERHLTPNYRERLNESDTVLTPIEIPVVVRDGILYLNNFAVATNDVRIRGNGRISLTGAVEASAILNIHPDLSQALMRSVNTLQYIMNQQGEIEIPVALKGTLGEIKVVPDMNYILNRVVSTKGQELISDLLTKKKEGSGGAAQTSSGDQVQGLLKGFLGS